MYKYRIKLYICSECFVPIDPKLPKAQDKTMQGVGHDINNIQKMSRPMSKCDIVKQNPNGGYEEN